MEYLWLTEVESALGGAVLKDSLALDNNLEKSLSVAIIAMYKKGVLFEELGLIIPPIKQSEYRRALLGLGLSLPVKTTLELDAESFCLVQQSSELWDSL